MSLDCGLENMHDPSLDEAILHVPLDADFWRQGDPPFDAIDELLRIQAGRNLLPRGFILRNPDGYARRWQDLSASLPPLTMSGRTTPRNECDDTVH
jgi:hypothetical protein